MTTFVQLIDFETDRASEMSALMDEWLAATEGKRTATSEMLMHDRENARHYVEMVEFPSYEEAMRNNELPETQAFAERMRSLCSSGPSFINLDLERREN